MEEEVVGKKVKAEGFGWEPFEDIEMKKVVSISEYTSNALTKKSMYIRGLVRRRHLMAGQAGILLSLLKKKKTNALLGFSANELKGIGFSDRIISRISMLIRPSSESVESICDALYTDDTRIINAVIELKDHLYSIDEKGNVGIVIMSVTGYDDIQAASNVVLKNTDLPDWAKRRYKEYGGGDGPSDPPKSLAEHIRMAINLYGRFKTVKTEEIVIDDESIFFDSRHPRLFLLFQYGDYIPSLLLICLYAIHYALRTTWDMHRDTDRDKLALLKTAILALKPQYEDFLKRLTEQLEKISPEIMKNKKDEQVIDFVEIEVPDDFELIVIDKSPLVSSLLSDRVMQYRLYWFLENKVCPEIYGTKRWSWAMLRSAMVIVGLFSGMKGTERGKEAVKDSKFARGLLPFITNSDIEKYAINYDSLRIATGRKEKCDAKKDSADYKMVLEIAKMLKKYKLGAPSFVDEV